MNIIRIRMSSKTWHFTFITDKARVTSISPVPSQFYSYVISKHTVIDDGTFGFSRRNLRTPVPHDLEKQNKNAYCIIYFGFFSETLRYSDRWLNTLKSVPKVTRATYNTRWWCVNIDGACEARFDINQLRNWIRSELMWMVCRAPWQRRPSRAQCCARRKRLSSGELNRTERARTRK